MWRVAIFVEADWAKAYERIGEFFGQDEQDGDRILPQRAQRPQNRNQSKEWGFWPLMEHGQNTDAEKKDIRLNGREAVPYAFLKAGEI